DDCLLLVDTIHTLESGVPNAIKVFKELQRKGHKPVGIRLDSGDLAYLSIAAAKMLDEASFPETSIVLPNQLDELVILQIITQIREEAPRNGLDADHLINRLVYGVGTGLITSKGDSALDGVYKLVAVQDDGQWKPAIKLSETLTKTPNPGHKRVWRVYARRGRATPDLISRDDEDARRARPRAVRQSTDHTKQRALEADAISEIEPLLVDILKDGKLVYDLPTIEQMRQQRNADLERLDAGVQRIVNPHIYHVSLTERLWSLKQEMIKSIG